MFLKKDRQKFSLMAIDSISVFISFFFAYYLRNFGPFTLLLDQVQPLITYLRVLPAASILLILTFSAFSLYKKEIRINSFDELLLSIKAQGVWILLIMSTSYLSKYDYSRLIVIITFFFNLIILNLLRYFYKKYEIQNYSKGIGVTNILIVGAGRPGRDISRKLQKYEHVGYKIVGFVDDNAKTRENFPIIGKLKDLKKIIKTKKVDVVYFTDPRMSYEKILTISSQFVGKHLTFKVARNLFDIVKQEANYFRVENIPALNFWKSDLNSTYYFLKRFTDIILSVVLLITTLPLWLLIILLVIKEDGPPAIIKLERVGYKGQPFMIYKFRTMKKGTNKNAKAPRSEKDNRVTKVGKILRRTSLDELPQLLNILKGEMSLVGPRPEIPQIVKKYSKWQKLRLEAKPGLTGLWQVLGRKDLPLHENIEYDFYYINNHDLIMDLAIILKTIPIVLGGRGAY